MEDDILLQILKEDPDIEDAEKRYRQFVADDELRERYQDGIKAERDRRSQLIYAERTGEERGRREERLDVARRMKARGVPTDHIVELTGLSMDEVNDLD